MDTGKGCAADPASERNISKIPLEFQLYYGGKRSNYLDPCPDTWIGMTRLRLKGVVSGIYSSDRVFYFPLPATPETSRAIVGAVARFSRPLPKSAVHNNTQRVRGFRVTCHTVPSIMRRKSARSGRRCAGVGDVGAIDPARNRTFGRREVPSRTWRTTRCGCTTPIVGCYLGCPPDDDTAIQEQERLRLAGADFIVFGSRPSGGLIIMPICTTICGRGFGAGSKTGN